jgi:DNA-binding beta-propeller fold protein YncE
MRGILSSLCLCLLALPASAASPSAAAPSPALMYLGTWPHKIDVIDANTGKIVDMINLNTDIARQLVLSPDHKKLYAATLADNSIVTIDLATRKVMDSFSLDGGNEKNRLSGLTIDPTGKYLYSIGTVITKGMDHYDIGTPKFIVIDLSQKRITRSVDFPKDEETGGYRSSLRVSPDGKYLYLFRDAILVFDSSTFKLVKKIDLQQPPVPDMMNLRLNFVDDPNEEPGKVIGFFNSSDPFVHREVFGVAELNLSTLSFDLTPLGPVTATMMSPMMLTPDRKLGYTAVANGEQGNRVTEFWVIDMTTKKIIAKKEFTGRTRFNFGMSADGKKLLIYNAGFQIEVYDAKTLEMTSDIDLEGDTTSNLIVMPTGE